MRATSYRDGFFCALVDVSLVLHIRTVVVICALFLVSVEWLIVSLILIHGSMRMQGRNGIDLSHATPLSPGGTKTRIAANRGTCITAFADDQGPAR